MPDLVVDLPVCQLTVEIAVIIGGAKAPSDGASPHEHECAMGKKAFRGSFQAEHLRPVATRACLVKVIFDQSFG